MKPMSTAPKDGTRILIKSIVKHCTNYIWVDDGTKWVEAWFTVKWGYSEGCWAVWCGNERVSSTDVLFPLGWADRPSDSLEDS